MTRRFSKAMALQVLDQQADKIAAEHKFNRSNGTAQLKPDDIERAISYGRMRAFEDFACMIEEWFQFQIDVKE